MTIFTHAVLTDEQLEKEKWGLLEPGDYKFQIVSASLEVSKKGNPMIKIILNLQGKEIVDYIMDSGPMRFKIKHLLASIGLGYLYTQAQWDMDVLINKVGTAKVDIQKGKPKPDGSGNYYDKNNIVDYLVVNNVNSNVVSNISDDDIPF